MRNVEIKAYVHDIEEILKLSEIASGNSYTIINQDDTFYKVINGRMKMRFFDSKATLVRYERENTEGPKMSDYDLLHFDESEMEKAKLLDKMLQTSLGTCGRVVKERKLFIVNNSHGFTRIHIDTVQDLGHFMELEVVLSDNQSLEEGQKIAKELQLKLNVRNEDLIDCAYVDLFNKKQNRMIKD